MKFLTVFFIVLLSCRFSLSQVLDGSLPVDGAQRTFHFYTPAVCNTSKTYPLVIMLHGGGGQGQQMMRFTHFNELADRDSFLVVYPDGWNHQWNDHRVGDKLPFEKDDVQFISSLIAYLAQKYHADTTRVFVAGISNGAIFSLFLAQELGSKIRAIAPVCGSIPANYAATYHIAPSVSVLIINGTADPLVKYEGGPVVSTRAQRGSVISTDSMILLLLNGINCKSPVHREAFADTDTTDGCTAEKFIYPTCSAGKQLELIKVTGGGHTWPGGIQYLPKSVVGNVCRDFNATDEISNFFKSQSRTGK